jgi:hypothetical protein
MSAAVAATATTPAPMRARSSLNMVLVAPLGRKAREPISVDLCPPRLEQNVSAHSRSHQDLSALLVGRDQCLLERLVGGEQCLLQRLVAVPAPMRNRFCAFVIGRQRGAKISAPWCQCLPVRGRSAAGVRRRRRPRPKFCSTSIQADSMARPMSGSVPSCKSAPY